MNWPIRLKRKPDGAIAQLSVTVYNGSVQVEMYGDEANIGGALVAAMMQQPNLRRLLTTAAKAAETIAEPKSKLPATKGITLHLN